MRSDVISKAKTKKGEDSLSSMSEEEYDMLVKNDMVTLDLKTVEVMRDK